MEELPPELPDDDPASEVLPEPAGRLAWLNYLLLPPLTLLAILGAARGPGLSLLLSPLVVLAWWIGFARSNWRICGLELIGVVLATYYIVQPPLAVLWVVASALGGAMGAWLMLRRRREDDYFFLVPLAAAIGFVILAWLGGGARIYPALELGAGWLDGLRRGVERDFALLARESPGQAQYYRDMLEPLGERFAVTMISTLAALWVLALWGAGRIARRGLGLLGGLRGAFILFRIGQPYIFLLIAGLVMAILDGLTPLRGLRMVAIPLLVVVAVGCFIEAMAVILFFGALQRAAGRIRTGFVWDLAGLALLLWLTPLGLLLGLTDVWFDYRRLEAAGRRAGLEL